MFITIKQIKEIKILVPFSQIYENSYCTIKNHKNIHHRLWISNQRRVTSYELRVTIYCTSYELLFTYELRVITYCTSYELIFTYELRVTIYCTSYKLNLSYELRVPIYRTSWGCNVDYRKFLYYTSYSFLWPALCKIKYSSSAVPEQCIS